MLLINQNILSTDRIYLQQEAEYLLNNFGGLMQVIIVRMESLDERLIYNICDTLTLITSFEPCRPGALLILSGLLYVMS